MAENNHRLPDLTQPDQRHEHADVNAWAIGKFGIGLVLLCIVSCVLLVGLFRYFETMDGGTAKRIAVPAKLPPAPVLETTPVQDLQSIRAGEELVLHSYGWVDQQKGVVRIPVDRAIDLLAQRGLPSRAQAGTPVAATGVSVPTESGLGAKMLPPGGPLSGELK